MRRADPIGGGHAHILEHHLVLGVSRQAILLCQLDSGRLGIDQEQVNVRSECAVPTRSAVGTRTSLNTTLYWVSAARLYCCVSWTPGALGSTRSRSMSDLNAPCRPDRRWARAHP